MKFRIKGSATEVAELESLKYAIDCIEEEVYAFTPDGFLHYANAQARRRYRIPDDLATAHFHLERINPGIDVPRFRAFYARLEAQGGPCTIMATHSLADGGKISVALNIYNIPGEGGIPLVWAYARDLTDQMRQQHRVNELNGMMEVFANHTSLCLMAKRTEDMRYIYWNAALERLSGISAEQAIGRTASELFPYSLEIKRLDEVDRALLKKGGDMEVVTPFCSPDGKIRMIRSVRTLVDRKAESGSLITGLLCDVTNMKAAEKEMVTARFLAEKSSRMHAALLADLSREVRTRLAEVSDLARDLAAEADPVRRQQYAGAILGRTQGLERQIEAMVQRAGAQAAEAGVKVKPDAQTPQGDKARRNILIAEDVDSNYMLLEALIGRQYNLRRALDGSQAVEMFLDPDYVPDLILMDMKMPVMDGLQATREIRSMSSEVPIIALTANAFNDDRVEALEAGSNDFLTKPVSAETLRRVIERYIGE